MNCPLPICFGYTSARHIIFLVKSLSYSTALSVKFVFIIAGASIQFPNFSHDYHIPLVSSNEGKEYRNRNTHLADLFYQFICIGGRMSLRSTKSTIISWHGLFIVNGIRSTRRSGSSKYYRLASCLLLYDLFEKFLFLVHSSRYERSGSRAKEHHVNHARDSLVKRQKNNILNLYDCCRQKRAPRGLNAPSF